MAISNRSPGVQRHPRQVVSLLVGLGDQLGPGRSRNLSLSGLFLETPARPPVGSNVDMWFVWGEDTYVVKASVVRHAPDGLGVSFTYPDPAFLAALAEILEISPA